MNSLKLAVAAALLCAIAATPGPVDARSHHRNNYGYYSAYYGRYRDWYPLPYPISYLHNYGPGPAPGTFAYFDGPSTNFCYQGSAAYIGQDHQRHPCF